MRTRSAAFWIYGERLFALGPQPRPAGQFFALREQMDREGTPRTTSGDWERLLRFHRAITGAGTRRVDDARLLRVFSWFRAAHLGAPLPFATHRNPEALSQTLKDHGIPHAFGAITAANHWAFYEAAPSIQVYVPPRLQAAARRVADEAPRARDAAVLRGEVFADAPSGLVVAGHDLERIEAAALTHGHGPAYRDADIETRSSAPFPVTNRFLSLLDCMVHPDGASHAAFLRTQLADRRST